MILNPKNIKLQYYVLNYDSNAHKVVHFNIYRNWLLNDHTVAEIRKHLRNKKKYPFEKFVQEVSVDNLYKHSGWVVEGRRQRKLF